MPSSPRRSDESISAREGLYQTTDKRNQPGSSVHSFTSATALLSGNGENVRLRKGTYIGLPDEALTPSSYQSNRNPSVDQMSIRTLDRKMSQRIHLDANSSVMAARKAVGSALFLHFR
ncbi:unnamed protein product [Bursaphelenchus xylophilus]|uniref:(pine wood nematode) hypothetical protein n=1 Tax=Bursaphelenchus xylophilus TaxID=6326 RepID=A0A7I8WYX9_BURXY|nr:unnamed protein product [Bursaphelenchus xylophilus]CAG9101298.1 unnamed protein product [Bursaphelenchus xylophilus]